jgi:hypothetical protein
MTAAREGCSFFKVQIGDDEQFAFGQPQRTLRQGRYAQTGKPQADTITAGFHSRFGRARRARA